MNTLSSLVHCLAHTFSGTQNPAPTHKKESDEDDEDDVDDEVDVDDEGDERTIRCVMCEKIKPCQKRVYQCASYGGIGSPKFTDYFCDPCIRNVTFCLRCYSPASQTLASYVGNFGGNFGFFCDSCQIDNPCLNCGCWENECLCGEEDEQ